MNLIGKWKVKETIHFSLENGMEWKTLEELEALGEDEDSLSTYRNSVMIFHENGTAENLMILPSDCTQEQIEAVIAEGHEIRDGMMVLDCKEWKTEDGKNLYNTGNKGEILGEEISPGVEFQEVDDMIELQLLRYERAE